MVNTISTEMKPISLRDIARVVFKHGKPFLFIILFSLTGSMGYVMFATPTYTATTKILVKIGREKFSALQNADTQSYNVMFNERPQNVNNEIEILRDPALIDNIFTQLKTEMQKPIPLPEPETFFEHIKYYVKTAKNQIKESIDFVISIVKEPFYQMGLIQRLSSDDALKIKFIRALKVVFIKETDLIEVSFHWNNPFFASYALNAYVNAYKFQHVRIHNEDLGSVEFYKEKVDSLTSQILTIKGKMQAFLDEAEMSSISSKDIEITLNYISKLENDLADKKIKENNLQQNQSSLENIFKTTNKWIVHSGVVL